MKHLNVITGKTIKKPKPQPPKPTWIPYKLYSAHTPVFSHKLPQTKRIKNLTTWCHYSSISHHLSILVSCFKILDISHLNSAMVASQRICYTNNSPYSLCRFYQLACFQELQNQSQIKLVQLQLKVRRQSPCIFSCLSSIVFTMLSAKSL